MVSDRGFEILTAAITANFIAQLYKFITYWFVYKKINLRRLVQTGGMPSSHSSFVMGMSTSTGLIEGFSSVAFSIALCISFVVMYDAAGLRRAVGKQANVLNQILEEAFLENKNLASQRFRELLGHTPYEVLIGALLGIIVSLSIHWYSLIG